MDIPEPIKDLRNLKIVNKKRMWQPFMEKYKCNIIGELGVFQGENFELMIKHKPEKAVAIDSYKDDGTPSTNDMGFTQQELNTQYLNLLDKMTDKPYVEVIRKKTYDASKSFPDNYFDLLYIDADHSYEGCLNDLRLWFPKIKKGKFLIGDDYRIATAPRTKVEFGVIEAVNTFSKEKNLQVYELPRYSWAIVKPLNEKSSK